MRRPPRGARRFIEAYLDVMVRLPPSTPQDLLDQHLQGWANATHQTGLWWGGGAADNVGSADRLAMEWRCLAAAAATFQLDHDAVHERFVDSLVGRMRRKLREILSSEHHTGRYVLSDIVAIYRQHAVTWKLQGHPGWEALAALMDAADAQFAYGIDRGQHRSVPDALLKDRPLKPASEPVRRWAVDEFTRRARSPDTARLITDSVLAGKSPAQILMAFLKAQWGMVAVEASHKFNESALAVGTDVVAMEDAVRSASPVLFPTSHADITPVAVDAVWELAIEQEWTTRDARDRQSRTGGPNERHPRG